MTPAERTRILQIMLAASHKVKETVTLEGVQSGPFFDALRGRTPRIIATPSLIALSAVTFLFGYSPVLDLVISTVCLWQIGLILERMVGPLAFTTVYVASGVAASVASFSASPGGMSVAASRSVLGMYGLLLVTSTWHMIRESDLTIPLKVTKRLASVAGVFVLYKLTSTGLWNRAELAAIVCGLVGGIIVARDVTERTP